MKRVALYLLAVLIALVTAGFAYETIATEMDSRAFPPPGQLVAITDSVRLHIHCLGNGSPTVILESSLPAGSPVWGWVQPGVAATTRVCAYDRAGEAWSDLGAEPRDAVRVATELHTLLERAGIADSLVLVGHSFGGLYARVFAHRYPDRVVGMVLIDASHPDQWTRTPEGAQIQRVNEVSAEVAPWLARLGVLRLTGYFKIDPDMPPRQQDELRAAVNGTRMWDSDRAVFRAIEATMEQTRAAGSLGARPLIVLTATEHGFPPDIEALHQQLQAELATLSSNAQQRVLQGATHFSPVNKKQQAQTTVAAIAEVVAAARR